MDFFKTFSPVIKPSTVHVVFTLVVTYGWDIKKIDINSAFLYGGLQETIFMTQPEGLKIYQNQIMSTSLKRPCMVLSKLQELGMTSLKQP